MFFKLLFAVLALVLIGISPAAVGISQGVLSCWGVVLAICFLARTSDPCPHSKEQFWDDWGPPWWHAIALGCAIIWFLKDKGVY